MIRHYCTFWFFTALLASIFLLGSFVGFAETVPPLAPAAVGGKEYSNTFDETA